MVDVVDVPRDWQQLGVIPAVIWRALPQPLWAMTGLQSDLRELAYNQRAGLNYKHVLMFGANMFYHCLLIQCPTVIRLCYYYYSNFEVFTEYPWIPLVILIYNTLILII